MTPDELSKQVMETNGWLKGLKENTSSPPQAEEEWDPIPDFWESIELMQTSLQQMEMLCKMDLDLKFLTYAERARLMSHTAEVMTFLDLYTDTNGKEKE